MSLDGKLFIKFRRGYHEVRNPALFKGETFYKWSNGDYYPTYPPGQKFVRVPEGFITVKDKNILPGDIVYEWRDGKITEVHT